MISRSSPRLNALLTRERRCDPSSRPLEYHPHSARTLLITHQEYAGNYLKLVKHSVAGWQELRAQKELQARVDIDEIYDLAIKGKGLTEDLFRGLQQNYVNWKHIDPNRWRLGLIVVAGVPIVVAIKRMTDEVVAAQCPALLRYAAQAVIGGATDYRPDPKTELLLYPDSG